MRLRSNLKRRARSPGRRGWVFLPECSQRVGGFLTPGRRALVIFCALFLRIYFKQPALRMGFKISEEAALALPIAAHSRLAYALTVGFIASKSPNA